MVRYKHPVVKWAHEHPVLFALFGSALVFSAPARIIGRTIRTLKTGSPDLGGLGAAPGSPFDEATNQMTGSGQASAVSYLGALPMPNPKPVTGGALFKQVYEHYQQLADEGKMQQEFVLMAANEKYAEMNRSGAYNIVTMNAPQPGQGKNPGDFYRDTGHVQKIHPDRQNLANPITSQREINRGASIAPPVEGKVYKSDGGTTPNYPGANQSVVDLISESSAFAGLGGIDRLR